MKLGKALLTGAVAALSLLAHGWDASSYKQTGRVAQWDALENAGYHRRNASATVWKDLAWGHDLTLTSNGTWGDAWLNVSGLSAIGPVLKHKGDVDAAGVTFEVVYRMTNKDGCSAVEVGLNNGTYNTIKEHRLYFTDSGTRFRFWGDSAWRKRGNITYDESDHVAQCRYESNVPAHWMDGKSYTVDDNHNGGAGSGHVTIGARTDAGDDSWWGRIYAVRLYDHILTVDEINQNRIIDNARFFDTYPANSIYVTADDERCGNPSSGYALTTNCTVGADYVFTVSSEYTNETDGVAATCDGWELYKSGKTTPFRTSADAGESAMSCTVTFEENVRLRWTWSNVRYRVRASVVGGTVDKSEQWVASGSSASVTASGSAGLTFVGWSGGNAPLATTTGWTALDGPQDVTGAFMKTDFTAAVATYYVAKGGSDENDGLAVAQALATPSAALTKAKEADGIAYVVVAPGTYELSSTLAFDAKSVRLIGAGRDCVTFDYGYQCRGVILNAAQARLQGIEIYRGYIYDSKDSFTGHGGGAVVSAGTVEDCRFRTCDVMGGWAFGYGGGVAVSGSGRVTGCEITDCRCLQEYSHGNAAYVYGGTVSNCNIFANNGGYSSSNLSGGGASAIVYLTSGTLVASRIHDNEKQMVPGVYQKNGTLANCLIYNNVGGSGTTAGYGAAGVYKENGNMYHCTVWGNVLNLDETGISGIVQVGGTTKNNIITGNGPSGSSAGSCKVTKGTFSQNAIDMALTGYDDNTVGDAKLQDPENADFRLASKASAAYHYGLPIAGQATDFAGRARDTATPSVGAYEYDSSVEKFSVDIVLDRNDYKAGETVVATTFVTAAESSECAFAWKVDGAAIAGTGPKVEVAGLATGSHTLQVTITKTGESPASNTASVKVWPLKTYVGGTGEGTEPYDEPGKATSSLTAAFKALWPGSDVTTSVELGAGTFSVDSTVQMSRPVQIIGAGKDSTVLDFGNAVRGFVLSSAAALVKDLTVSNAYGKTTGGGAFWLSAGVVDGCRVTDSHCDSTWDVGHGGGVELTGSGRFLNGEITRCWTGVGYGKGTALHVGGASAIASNCNIHANNSGFQGGVAADGVYDAGGSVYVSAGKFLMSRVHDNFRRTVAGVLQNGGLVANCLIYGNSTQLTEENGVGSAGLHHLNGTTLYCTIWGNTNRVDATGLSGLVMGTYKVSNSGSVRNCIVWGNGPETCTAGSCNVTAGTFESNVVDVALASYPANIVGDPKFRDIAARDLRIATKASAAYQTALPTASVTTDFACRDRDAVSPTIGAYEYDSSLEAFGVALATTQEDSPTGATVRVTAHVSGAHGAAYTLVWTLDGEVVEELTTETADFEDLACGRHAIGVTAEIVGKETVSDALTVRVRPYEAYVNQTGSGTYPYDTPEKGTNDLAEAYDAVWRAADATTTVHVASGDYLTERTVSVAFPVRIVGAGKGATRLARSTATSGRVFVLSQADALVADLTVTGAVAGAFNVSAGTVSDCVVSNCYPNGYSHGLAYYVTGGLVTSCEAVDCQNNSTDGKGTGYYVTGATVSNCVARRCGHLNSSHENETYYKPGGGFYCSEGGRITHCLIEECGSAVRCQDGAAIYAWGHATIDHCTIRGNLATAGSIVRLLDKLYTSGDPEYTPKMSQTLIEGSTADSASSAEVLCAGGGDLLGCTIAGNDTSVAVNMASGSATNCIFAANGAGSYSFGTTAVGYSCCPALTDGANGNITAAPRFRQRKKVTYHLSRESPCHNIGLVSPYAVESTDLDGRSRLTDGHVDMGCYEDRRSGFTIFYE